jgi:hypothetical protein
MFININSHASLLAGICKSQSRRIAYRCADGILVNPLRHVIFETLDFIARLAALVPKPWVSLTRFHGVFAPNSKYRGRVTPGKRGGGGRQSATGDEDEPTPVERRAAMRWAERLERVFGIDIESCSDVTLGPSVRDQQAGAHESGARVRSGPPTASTGRQGSLADPYQPVAGGG